MDATNTPQRRRGRDDDEDFPLIVAPPRPLIEPGVYDAKSVSVHKDRMYDRYSLRIGFRVFDGPYDNGVLRDVVIDGFWSLGTDNKRPGPSTKIARLMQLVGASPKDFRSSMLKDKLFRVRVVTVEMDREGTELPEPNRYSKVADVLERIA